MTKKLKTPHDTFFQSMMEDLEIAKAFFQAHLSPELVQAIDWSTLDIADAVRRPPQRKPTYTDITYHCLSQDHLGHIYLHAEQERGIDPTMLERTLQYNAGLLLKHRKQGHKKLPLIINTILYNGIREDYPYYEDLYDYFDHPSLARSVMSKPFILINLNKQPDETLVGHGAVGFMELLLKRASHTNFITWMCEHKELARIFLAGRYVNQGIDYILEVGQGPAEAIIATLVSIDPARKETIMTAAQQLRQEGMQEGMQQGMQEGMQEEKLVIARNLLRKNMDVSFITETTGLDKKTITKLKEDKAKKPS